jgi:hypothetical protein
MVSRHGFMIFSLGWTVLPGEEKIFPAIRQGVTLTTPNISLFLDFANVGREAKFSSRRNSYGS